MVVASLISVVSAIVGMYFSYIYNIPSGATIVLCAFAIYIGTFIYSKITQQTRKGVAS